MILFNGLITNDKFCLSRVSRQKLRYARRPRTLPCGPGRPGWTLGEIQHRGQAMSTQQIRKRVEKVEAKVSPEHSGGCSHGKSSAPSTSSGSRMNRNSATGRRGQMERHIGRSFSDLTSHNRQNGQSVRISLGKLLGRRKHQHEKTNLETSSTARVSTSEVPCPQSRKRGVWEVKPHLCAKPRPCSGCGHSGGALLAYRILGYSEPRIIPVLHAIRMNTRG
jgi:hypothetical protein